MLDSPQHDFLTTELEPDLLSTPFRVQTNWHVITGAACSGKTTLIDLLADKGFQTEPETARQYIDREMARGQTLDEIFESEADERGIEDMQLREGVVAGQAAATEEGIAYEVAAATEDEVAYEAGVATEEGAAVVDAYAEVEGEAEQKEV